MNQAFYIGATALRTEQQALEIVANNIANMNTTAFKRSSVQFAELLSTPRSTEAAGPPQEFDSTFAGVSVQATPQILAQGPLKQTGQAMDIAVNGDGFFEVLGPSGQTMLWRGGTLQISSDGHLAAANGMALKAMIAVPAGATSLTIGPDGTVQALVTGESKPAVLGNLELALVKDPSSLTDMGGGFYQVGSEQDLTIASPGQDGAGLLAQGSLEGSNVQLTDEMTALLLTQRAYGAAAQVVQAGDQLMSITNSLRR